MAVFFVFCKISIFCYDGIEYSYGIRVLGTHISLGRALFLVQERFLRRFLEKTAR
jgi:hypothetical protein